jgi:hypothetical protein
MTDDREKLIDKIRKIKRKADGTSSEAEAHTFLQKMSVMMEANGITMAELKEKDMNHGFGFSIYNLRYSDAWRKNLMWASAKLCGCVGVHMGSMEGTQFKIFGRPENVEIAVETYVYMHDQIRAIARSLYGSDRKQYIEAQKGLSFGVQVKINEIMQKAMKEGAEGAIDTKVPMIVEHQVVRDFVKAAMSLKPAKTRFISGTPAFYNGLNNAGRVDVRKVVG